MLGNRLQQIMDHYHLNPMSFSERLQIQRSSLSHFFTGRNKPGWDFLEKLARTFPEINLQWLLTGSGDMLNNIVPSLSSPLPQQENEIVNPPIEEKNQPTDTMNEAAAVDKVIIFYRNGSCKIYHPDC